MDLISFLDLLVQSLYDSSWWRILSGCLISSQSQINQIRRFFSIPFKHHFQLYLPSGHTAGYEVYMRDKRFKVHDRASYFFRVPFQ